MAFPGSQSCIVELSSRTQGLAGRGSKLEGARVALAPLGSAAAVKGPARVAPLATRARQRASGRRRRGEEAERGRVAFLHPRPSSRTSRRGFPGKAGLAPGGEE